MPLPVPRTATEITSAWLNEVLPEDVRDGASIVHAGIQVIGEGVGFLGEVARLSLTYDRPAAAAPASVISKVPTANDGFRHLGTTLGLYQRENAFFTFAAAETPMRIPRCYYLHGDPSTETFALLLEDFATMRPGNQLASCSIDEARLAMGAAAGLHARWWNSPRLQDFAAWLPGAGDPYFLFLEMAFRQAIPAFDAIYGHLIAPEVRQLVDRFADDYQRLVEGLAADAVTMVHGDYRLDNMLFGQDPDARLLKFWEVMHPSPPPSLAGPGDPYRRSPQTCRTTAYSCRENFIRSHGQFAWGNAGSAQARQIVHRFQSRPRSNARRNGTDGFIAIYECRYYKSCSTDYCALRPFNYGKK